MDKDVYFLIKNPTCLVLYSNNKFNIKKIAAFIKLYKKSNLYKGTGIFYDNEFITLKKKNNNKNIILNIYFSKEQKRYTIAYLISSYLIFYNNEKFLGSHFLGSHVFDNEIEEVAAFARMLLIPDNKLKASISKDCETLAYFFKVPVEVMDKRLKEVYKKDKILQRKKD